MASDDPFEPLLAFLESVPAIALPAGRASIGRGRSDDGTWWAQFTIELSHPLSWRVVQEFAHVLNLLSADERLPTAFKPVSPPPYLNGGPEEFLSWVIETEDPSFSPTQCVEWLKNRLPQPVADAAAWDLDDAEDTGPLRPR